MKDYRPLLSDVAILVEAVADLESNQIAKLRIPYDSEDLNRLAEELTEMFNELDYDIEGAEVY